LPADEPAMTFVRTRIKELLRRYDRRVVYLPPGTVTGAELEHDLRALVGHDAPVCLDVGANEGQTIALFQRVFSGPHIHAFEPSRKTFEQLALRQFGDRVSLHNYAMAERPVRRELIRYASSDLSSFLPLASDAENRFREMPIDTTEIVDVRTVDAFVAEAGLTVVDLLKIDTQGTDLDVLRGASAALQSGIVRHVMVEINFVRMYEGQNDALDVVQYLRARGLHLVDFYEKVYQANTLAWCTALFSRRPGGVPQPVAAERS
jgi:FkbM family methyltransferase